METTAEIHPIAHIITIALLILIPLLMVVLTRLPALKEALRGKSTDDNASQNQKNFIGSGVKL